MNIHAVPPEVDEVLAAAGFRAVGPVGPGGSGLLARALDGSAWAVELYVVPGRLDDDARARIGALRAVRHEHVARLLEVVALPGDRLALFVEHHEGPSVRLLLAARAALSEGEAVTVAIPIAQGLGALHDAGVAHGAVGPDSVVVRPDGRPVLVDLRAAVAGTGAAGGDVTGLVECALAALPPEPGPADLVGALGELRDGSADARRVVDRCFRAVPPEPVLLPSAADLAAADVARVQGGERVAALRRVASGRPVAPDRWSVARRASIAVAALVLVGGLAVGVFGWRGAARAVAEPDGGSAAAAPASTSPATTSQASTSQATTSPDEQPERDPARAAELLTTRRAQVLVSADAAGLDGVDEVGGPAHADDLVLLASLGGDRAVGLDVRVIEARALDGDQQVARVRVVSTTSAYELVGPDGATRAGGPSVTATVVLELRWGHDGWRVWQVLPA
ncbi:hypothetical protein [Cellulomonas composti]|uniref:Protein kinase domain-containing protein n=1 Tax=Cellulomonas composti TaxID=266130 RepID=A0A511J814_9CELL|nr:hypothetical protein [Cellulomonas composti]GEL93843.1 hypothetical protein CCO02nite_05010 [Cellulomonas composti]